MAGSKLVKKVGTNKVYHTQAREMEVTNVYLFMRHEAESVGLQKITKTLG